MKATELLRTRVVLADDAFAELVLWRVPKPLEGSTHSFKYRLAYVVGGKGVVRFDTEVGKGDHRHIDDLQRAYVFETPEKVITDFQAEIARWNRENRHA